MKTEIVFCCTTPIYNCTCSRYNCQAWKNKRTL